MKSYDSWLVEGADIGLDGPMVCEPCAHDKHDQHVPDQCECDCQTQHEPTMTVEEYFKRLHQIVLKESKGKE
jgi:hypothetical protein